VAPPCRGQHAKVSLAHLRTCDAGGLPRGHSGSCGYDVPALAHGALTLRGSRLEGLRCQRRGTGASLAHRGDGWAIRAVVPGFGWRSGGRKQSKRKRSRFLQASRIRTEGQSSPDEAARLSVKARRCKNKTKGWPSSSDSGQMMATEAWRRLGCEVGRIDSQ